MSFACLRPRFSVFSSTLPLRPVLNVTSAKRASIESIVNVARPPLGFASTPFNRFSVFNTLLPFGQSFYYRGQYYAYNALGDCYTTQSPYYRFGGGYGGYVIAQAPPIYRPRAFDPGARNPITPQSPKARLAALRSQGVRTAQVGPRETTVPKVWLQVRNVDAALEARLRDIARTVDGSELKACGS